MGKGKTIMHELEVIMKFAGDFKTKILKFRMNGIAYTYDSTNYYVFQQTPEYITQFYVTTQEIIAELRLYNITNKWELVKMEKL